MYLHLNRVLYKDGANPSHRYRQIVVMEAQQFEVRIFEGDVVQTEPKFMAEGTDAEVYFHSTLTSALEDAEKEYRQSIAARWVPYTPT